MRQLNMFTAQLSCYTTSSVQLMDKYVYVYRIFLYHTHISLIQTQFIVIYPLLRLISWNLTTRCLAVTGSGSVGECIR